MYKRQGQETANDDNEEEQEPALKKQKKEQNVFEWHADPSVPVEFDGLDVTLSLIHI